MVDMTKQPEQFKFNTQDSIDYGVSEAVVLFNIRYWVKANKEKGINFHQGEYWTYNSYSKYTEVFPMFSEKQIRRILISLIKQGAIIDGNFNKKGYDKTKWYTLAYDHTGKSICPNGQTNTIVKPIIKQDHEINNDNRCSLMYEDTEENNINFVDKMR